MNLEQGEEIEGHFYESDTVYPTNIRFPDDEIIESVDAKFNLLTNNLELKINNQTLILRGRMLKSFSQNGSKYVQGKNLQNYGLIDSLFYRVIVNDKCQLFATSQLVLQPNNYNEILDVGEKKDRYIKKTEYLFFRNEELVYSSVSLKKMTKFISKRAYFQPCDTDRRLKSTESDMQSFLSNCCR
ncbi:hypothetical protein [Reichenbachiella sp.]|uniref:hypothetical protein n=1 Tax=Reichenbachiella sp. TaxID=2184521 RepID=UPI003BB11210